MTERSDQGEAPLSAELERFDQWAARLLNREMPRRIKFAPEGRVLNQLKVIPGEISILGGMPGAGKSALVNQIVFEALRRPDQANLRALIANIEMSENAMLGRELARLTGVDFDSIRDCSYDANAKELLRAGYEKLRKMRPRIEFLPPPYRLDHLQRRATEFAADIVVVDYIQRFLPSGGSNDPRMQTAAVMDVCRQMAEDGRAVLAVAAVNRDAYHNVPHIGVFRDSSEVEYSADAAYVLHPKSLGRVILYCVKHRYGATGAIPLQFLGQYMRFTDPD